MSKIFLIGAFLTGPLITRLRGKTQDASVNLTDAYHNGQLAKR